MKYIIDTFTNDKNIMDFPVFRTREAAEIFLAIYCEDNNKDISDYEITEY